MGRVLAIDGRERGIVMKAITGSKLPVSREATVRLRRPNWQHVMPGTVLEANLKFFDNRLHEVCYKHSWWKRVWYTSKIGRHRWRVSA